MIMVTNLGDPAVLLPISAAILVWLLALRRRKDALWWGLAVAVCVVGTALSKIGLYACPVSTEIHSPSGHTALRARVYGGVAVILTANLRGWPRLAALVGLAATICGIAVSRVVLAAHNPLETIVGMGIGLSALALFASGYLRHRPLPFPNRALIVSVGLILVLFYGHELRAEQMLQAIGVLIHPQSRLCN
jgi:membrane-associated phospholipid phosphatase